MNRGGSEREGDTESHIGSRPPSLESSEGLKLRNCEIMT